LNFTAMVIHLGGLGHDQVSKRNPHTRGPEQFITQAVTALHLFHDCSRLVFIGSYRIDSFMDAWIERLAQALNRADALLLEKIYESTIDRF
jgi:hypothetical protein